MIRTWISGVLSDCPKAVPSASVSFNYAVSIHPSIIHSLCSPTSLLLSWRAPSPCRVGRIKRIWNTLPRDENRKNVGRKREERTGEERKVEEGRRRRKEERNRVNGWEVSGRGMTGDEKHHREFHHLQKNSVNHLASEMTSHYWGSSNVWEAIVPLSCYPLSFQSATLASRFKIKLGLDYFHYWFICFWFNLVHYDWSLKPRYSIYNGRTPDFAMILIQNLFPWTEKCWIMILLTVNGSGGTLMKVDKRCCELSHNSANSHLLVAQGVCEYLYSWELW